MTTKFSSKAYEEMINAMAKEYDRKSALRRALPPRYPGPHSIIEKAQERSGMLDFKEELSEPFKTEQDNVDKYLRKHLLAGNDLPPLAPPTARSAEGTSPMTSGDAIPSPVAERPQRCISGDDNQVLRESGAPARDPSLREVPPSAVTRRRLPPRRLSLSETVEVLGTKVLVTVGVNTNGSLGEVFLTTPKPTTDIAQVLNGFAMALSIGLQCGVPLHLYLKTIGGHLPIFEEILGAVKRLAQPRTLKAHGILQEARNG